MISTITGTISSAVTLGSGSYGTTLTIASTGVINHTPTALYAGLLADVVNLGTIEGDIRLSSFDALSNAGRINGTTAISAYPGSTVTNSGSIIATQTGINSNNSKVLNSGFIEGGNFGIAATRGGYILNTGTILQGGWISGFEELGVSLSSSTIINENLVSGFDAIVENNSTIDNRGVILGQNIGAIGTGTGLILNSGTINGNITGVYFSGGTIINTGGISGITDAINAHGSEDILNYGNIYGADTGIGLLNGGTITNAGTITSMRTAIINSSTTAGLTIALAAGAQFTGLVQDDSKQGVLILGGATPGTLNMNATFSGFSQISFAPGVSWTLEGNAAELASGQTISGFGLGDNIFLDGFTATSESFISGAGLVLSNGTTAETIDIAGTLSQTTFTVSQTPTGSVIGEVATCFCRGTRIATARGNVPVETLRPGDLVKTATQGDQPVRWIGRRAYDGRFIAGNHLALPVKIRRHALGFNVPSRDLFVSPGHAICEAGVLVHAWLLVNGVSITQAEAVEQVEYFHIEMDRHHVIFAENTPVESFFDNGTRGLFQNAAEAPPPPPAQKRCLPQIERGYHLARLRARIDARAGIAPPATPGPLRGNLDEHGPYLRGWAQDETAPECRVELELLCDGQPVRRFLADEFRPDLRHAGLGSGCHAFTLPLPALNGCFALRRMSDGAVLGAQSWMATRRAG